MGAGHPLVEFVLTIIDHNQQLMAILRWSDGCQVKSVIYEEASWLERHRVAAYVVLYVQFLQMVLAFTVHPRVAMLTSTVQKALYNMMHFFFVFAILFLMLAFMANFLLGGRIHIFGTFGSACSAQVRMLFGEFIYADGVEVLSGTALVMYWLYAVSFMLIAARLQLFGIFWRLGALLPPKKQIPELLRRRYF